MGWGGESRWWGGAGRGGVGRGGEGLGLGAEREGWGGAGRGGAQEVASDHKVVQTVNAAVSVITALNNSCGNDR